VAGWKGDTLKAAIPLDQIYLGRCRCSSRRHDLTVAASSQSLAWCGVVFAALAALLWAGSAAVNIPLIGSGYGALVGLDEFYAAMRKIRASTCLLQYLRRSLPCAKRYRLRCSFHRIPL
jgi:hypothetical protein